MSKGRTWVDNDSLRVRAVNIKFAITIFKNNSTHGIDKI